jgi:hypothetical protein
VCGKERGSAPCLPHSTIIRPQRWLVTGLDSPVRGMASPLVAGEGRRYWKQMARCKVPSVPRAQRPAPDQHRLSRLKTGAERKRRHQRAPPGKICRPQASPGGLARLKAACCIQVVPGQRYLQPQSLCTMFRCRVTVCRSSNEFGRRLTDDMSMVRPTMPFREAHTCLSVRLIRTPMVLALAERLARAVNTIVVPSRLCVGIGKQRRSLYPPF